ncbi:hypothetical protein Drose_22560 [Dactylosporangium roseum]|uniref:Uncharacterized protein n=1 Tax=Dactylosporangium roseum TaxID=47989 RepID=A0ABY5YXD2_9ACTN|nr:hypothetical protein [Dactylosporangium roseum]UWZ34036.1 hypothetical protein Drose_22560 [Dactylosporangium roseum]
MTARRRAWTAAAVTAAAIAVVAGLLAAGHRGTAGTRRSAPPRPGATATAGPALTAEAVVDYSTESVNGFALHDPLTGGPDASVLRTGLRTTADWPAFLDRAGGAARDRLTVTLVFTGDAEPAVRITGVRVRLERTAEVLAGTAIVPAAAAPATVRVTCDLDDEAPALTDGTGADYFATRRLELRRGERSTVTVGFTARGATYAWTLLVDHVDGAGTARTAEIPGFRLTGSAPKYAATYVDNAPARGFSLARRR